MRYWSFLAASLACVAGVPSADATVINASVTGFGGGYGVPAGTPVTISFSYDDAAAPVAGFSGSSGYQFRTNSASTVTIGSQQFSYDRLIYDFRPGITNGVPGGPGAFRLSGFNSSSPVDLWNLQLQPSDVSAIPLSKLPSISDFSSFNVLGYNASDSRADVDAAVVGGTLSVGAPPEPPKPKTIGIFIGVNDNVTMEIAGVEVNDPLFSLKGVEQVQTLAQLFTDATGGSAFVLTADRRSGGGLTKEEVSAAIRSAQQVANAGDTIFLYVNSHGGSLLNGGVGDEVSFVGAGNDLFFTDDWLADQLRPLTDLNKLVFMDMCHSGGFWGSADPYEAAGHDLDSVSDLALLAAASEAGLGYGLGRTGKTFFGTSLEAVLSAAAGKTLTGQQLYDAVDADFKASNYDGELMFKLDDAGERTTFDRNLFSFSGYGLQNFKGGINATAVPEPSTWALMIAGFGLVGGAMRRRKVQVSYV